MPKNLKENLEMPMPEEELDMELGEEEGEEMMDFADYSDDELMLAVEEAKTRGLLPGGEEELPEEELDLGMEEEELA